MARASWEAAVTTWRRGALVCVAALFVLSGCTTQTELGDVSATADQVSTSDANGVLGESTEANPDDAAPAFEPTTPPAPTAEPTAVSTATPAPVPTPSPAPTATTSEDGDYENVTGPIAVPVAGITVLELFGSHPVLQLSNHTLLYLDEQRLAEVDIFVPYATGDGTVLEDFDAVAAELNNTDRFPLLDEVSTTTIDGSPALIFEGEAEAIERRFHTSAESIGDESAGWFIPLRLKLWLIDTPHGPVIVSAEGTTGNEALFAQATAMATSVLTTIEFLGPQ